MDYNNGKYIQVEMVTFFMFYTLFVHKVQQILIFE